MHCQCGTRTTAVNTDRHMAPSTSTYTLYIMDLVYIYIFDSSTTAAFFFIMQLLLLILQIIVLLVVVVVIIRVQLYISSPHWYELIEKHDETHTHTVTAHLV